MKRGARAKYEDKPLEARAKCVLVVRLGSETEALVPNDDAEWGNRISDTDRQLAYSGVVDLSFFLVPSLDSAHQLSRLGHIITNLQTVFDGFVILRDTTQAFQCAKEIHRILTNLTKPVVVVADKRGKVGNDGVHNLDRAIEHVAAQEASPSISYMAGDNIVRLKQIALE